MSARTALLIGACSGIATAIARELAAQGWFLLLTGRDCERLDALAQDLVARGAAGAIGHTLDVRDPVAVDVFFDHLAAREQRPGIVLIAPGVMTSNEDCRRDGAALRRMVETNFSGVAHCALRAVALLGRGDELVVISSVAGDRGRPKNFCYGSTKAGLDAFLEGLRLSVAGTGVNVMTLKPGPVDTPMNAHIPKGPIWASPEAVARVACAALGKGRHRVYAPRWWRLVMWVVRLLPARLMVIVGI
jgi:short-subunit dehydrogenase